MERNPTEDQQSTSSEAGSNSPKPSRLGWSAWKKLREEVLERDGCRCMNCSSEQRLEVHHIVPLSAGGANEPSNLITLCKKCHTKSEGKRVQNDPVALQNTNSYQLLLTPSEARRALQTVEHPLWRAATVLFAYYGIGSGELCNLELNDYNCSDQTIVEHFEIEHTTDPALEVVPGRKNASSRSRSQATTLPLPPEVEQEIIRYLAIRPDSGSDRLFLSTAKNWGEPITRDMLAHSLKDRSGERPQAFINCFKKYSQLDEHLERYLLTGDESSMEDSVNEVSKYTDATQYLFSQYEKQIYSLC